MSRLASQCLFASCFILLSTIMAIGTAFVRLLPTIAQLCLRGARSLLRMSYRTYRAVLSRMTKPLYNRTGFQILVNPCRTVATASFSLLLATVFLLLLRARTPWFLLGIGLAHGVYIGQAWDTLEPPRGIDVGENIP